MYSFFHAAADERFCPLHGKCSGRFLHMISPEYSPDTNPRDRHGSRPTNPALKFITLFLLRILHTLLFRESTVDSLKYLRRTTPVFSVNLLTVLLGTVKYCLVQIVKCTDLNFFTKYSGSVRIKIIRKATFFAKE